MRRFVVVLIALAFVGATDCRAGDIDVVVQDPNGQVLIPGPGASSKGANDTSDPWVGMDGLIIPDSPFSRGSGRLDQARPVGTPGYPMASDLFIPARPSQLLRNGLGAYFSSATGGFGFRIGYDRRLSPVLRLIAGTEFITYGWQQSLKKLGADLPPNVTRVTLIATPVGIQRQFATKKRVVPHIGFGVGPYLRLDHQAGVTSTYPGSVGMDVGTFGGNSGFNTNVGLPIDDFPSLSLTLGGFAAAGFDIRVGEKKDLAFTIDGRYTVVRFVDALGNPGDLGGPALAIGIGKYF